MLYGWNLCLFNKPEQFLSLNLQQRQPGMLTLSWLYYFKNDVFVYSRNVRAIQSNFITPTFPVWLNLCMRSPKYFPHTDRSWYLSLKILSASSSRLRNILVLLRKSDSYRKLSNTDKFIYSELLLKYRTNLQMVIITS